MHRDFKTVATLGSEAIPEVVDVLGESFFDYLVMRFVLGPEDDYASRLAILIRLFVMARILRGELILGLGGPGSVEGVALVSRPERESPPDLAALGEETWARLGTDARARYDACGQVWKPLSVDRPNLHVNMIGVRRRAQGQGVGRRLIDEVHRLSLEDPRSEGVTLTTESEANVALYRHLGYKVVGERTIASGLRTWGFFRPD